MATAGTADVLTSPFGSTRAQIVAAACRRARGRWGSARAGRGRSTHCAEVHVVGGRLGQRGAAVTPRVGELAAPPYFAGGQAERAARGAPPPRGCRAARAPPRCTNRRAGHLAWLEAASPLTCAGCAPRDARHGPRARGAKLLPRPPRWTAPVPRVRDGARRYATLCRLCCRAQRASTLAAPMLALDVSQGRLCGERHINYRTSHLASSRDRRTRGVES